MADGVCPYCRGEDVEYHGIDDGGGDFGGALTETWYCNRCEADFEGRAWGDFGDDVGGHGISTREILFAPLRGRLRWVKQKMAELRAESDEPEDLPF